MNFLKLNGRKILFKFTVVLCVWAVFNVVYRLAIRRKFTPEWRGGEIGMTMIVSAIFAVVWLCIHVFGYWNYYNSDKWLLVALLHRGIFDDGKHEDGTLYSGSRLVLTRESAYGFIKGYPAVVCFNSFIGQRTSSSLDVHVFVVQLNKAAKKTFSVSIPERYLPDDIEQQIFDFVEGLKFRGYVPAAVSDAKQAESLICVWG